MANESGVAAGGRGGHIGIKYAIGRNATGRSGSGDLKPQEGLAARNLDVGT